MEAEVSEHSEHSQGAEEEPPGSPELEEIPVTLDESAYETLSLNNSNSIAVRGKYYKQTYRPAWEQMPDFKGKCQEFFVLRLIWVFQGGFGELLGNRLEPIVRFVRRRCMPIG